MNRQVRRLLIAGTILGAVISAFASPAYAVEEVYSKRTVEIGRNLSCPVCQGQTVADSHSRVALEMMQAIQGQVDAGRSNDEIYDYFRLRYGDEVLVEPPREGINLALWWIPVAVVLLGLGVVGLYFRDSVALGPGTNASGDGHNDPELERLASQVLPDPDTETT